MNFSQFSKNKLNKEQMMAVKGGDKVCEDGPFGLKICKTTENGGCYISVGWSTPPTTPNGPWGWTELGGGHCVESVSLD